jgi:hypothetical protein
VFTFMLQSIGDPMWFISHCHFRLQPIKGLYRAYTVSRDSIIGIATSYGLDDLGVAVRVPVGSRIFSYPKSSRPAPRSTHPPIQWVLGDLSLGVKRPGREVDHSPPTSAEVKKMWIYTSTPICFHGIVLN